VDSRSYRMGVTTPGALGAVRVPCVDGRVRVTGPRRITESLIALLSSLRIPQEILPPLDVTISPDARTAEGIVDGRLMWSIALPVDAPAGSLLGHVVGTFTTLLTQMLFVHAGVVALDGRGVILVGESGSGKTSTVAALVRRGARYLSDEVALLDPAAGAVIPFLVPMAVKSWTRKAAGMLPAGRPVIRERGTEYVLPNGVESRPVVADMFVLLGQGNLGGKMSPISPAAMLLALARHTSSLKQRHRVEPAFRGFSKLLRNARCFALETAHPASQVERLVTLARGSEQFTA
jgi:hypothetical protein